MPCPSIYIPQPATVPNLKMVGGYPSGRQMLLQNRFIEFLQEHQLGLVHIGRVNNTQLVGQNLFLGAGFEHALCTCHVISGSHASPVYRSEEQTSELQSLMRISYAV